MKVLHVLNISVPKLAGYTTRSYHLVNNQKKLGIKPVVLTSERMGAINNDQEEIDGLNYYRTAAKNGLIRKVPLLGELNEIKCLQTRIAEVADKERVDIIHAHSPSLIGAACHDYCTRNNIPFVYEIRAFWEDAAVDRGAFSEGSLRYMLRRAHETKVVNKATAVIAICEGIKDDLSNRGCPKNKIFIVRNGVDFEMFKPAPANAALKKEFNCQDKIILGFIGSFFNFEGLEDLVFAMRKIVSRNNEILLLLVGKGQKDQELRSLVVSMGLSGNVIFAGQVPHEKVMEFYSIIDVFVYPRIKKRITDLVTPLKPLEAMAMGKPVLMSDVGGLRELVDVDGISVLFKAGDIDDLVSKCLMLCNDEAKCLEMGKKARQNIIKSWGWDKRAKSDLEIYHDLLDGNKRT